ncbi:hypothetical protein EUGRSUZ_H00915 [Eucalyptus grandis]|uniref:Pentacotripeptide-repeat region of PRORP domain-containing protein n=2 Tax=Eucalyptus grandis TaxID=71139 RepID=A0A059AWG4_EUCGR|nr:hypothetical protein EUGRSUZ_H00915 [Eucalyptus grandis]
MPRGVMPILQALCLSARALIMCKMVRNKAFPFTSFASIRALPPTAPLKSGLQRTNLEDAREGFDRVPTPGDVFSWNKLLRDYVRNRPLHQARGLFDEMPLKDVVSWNTMLSGYYRAKRPEDVYGCLGELGRCGVLPNAYTISMAISSFLDTRFKILVPQIHGRIVCLGMVSDVIVGSALMKGYANVGNPLALERVFDDLSAKPASSWNALVSGYMEMGHVEKAERIFHLMPESQKDVVSWTCLLCGYVRNKRIDEARSVFDRMSVRDVFSWTAMMNGYVRNEKHEDALKLFVLMIKSGSRPNVFHYSCVLSACAGASSLVVGQQVHSSIIKCGIPESDDVVVMTSLVDMYANCGEIDAAFCIFANIQNKNVASWNAVMGGYAWHGPGEKAIEIFESMVENGTKPDPITFINLLSACVHGGLVEEGAKFFDCMKTKYGIQPEVEHYACMVDLYGKAGLLEKAKKLIEEMPMEPDVVVWGAFIGACTMHSNLEFGEFAEKGIRRLKEHHPASYTMLLKIHGENGSWSRVLNLKRLMRKWHVRKQIAASWLDTS